MALKFPQKVKNLLDLKDAYSTFLFDLDGVYWNGTKRIQNAIDTYKELRKLGKQCYFVTNNSSQSRKSFAKKLQAHDVQADVNQVFCSASIAASYIQQRLPQVKKCYVVGMSGICEELTNCGIEPIWSGSIHKQTSSVSAAYFEKLQLDKDVGAVVVGIDYDFNYLKLIYASRYLQEGAHFIATNRDRYSMVAGKKMAGSGTIVNSISTACDIEPTVVGKPNNFIIDMLCESQGLEKKNMIMVGDNLETDIRFARNAGIDSLLVMTGVTNIDKLNKVVSESKQMNIPSFYADSA